MDVSTAEEVIHEHLPLPISDQADRPGRRPAIGRRASSRTLSPQQEAFILDRFSITLEDPVTGTRIRS